MSLVGFHRVFVVTAILFCLGFGARHMVVWVDGGPDASLVWAAGFGLIAVAFSVYLARLERILGRERNS